MAYRYSAFISYSSKDAVWAKWLHRKLETYRVPRSLVGRPGRDGAIPRSLFPVFRDRDELPLSADLGATINDALAASKTLIVLCSPSSAKSRWVNKEIEAFKQLGREDRVFALILDGIPNGSDDPKTLDQECFPEALRHRIAEDGSLGERTEPIGGDLRPGGDGKSSAFEKTVAGILGVSFDAIVQRERKRRFRRRLLVGAVGCLLVAAAFAYWDYNRTRVDYFRREVYVWGAPSGQDLVTGDALQHLGTRYRIESSQERVRRVYHENGAGLPVEESTRFSACEEDLFYKEDGQIDHIDIRNHNGQTVAKKVFAERSGNEQIVDFRRPFNDQPLTMTTIGSTEGTLSTVTAMKLEYAPDGLSRRVTNLNSYHVPVPDAEDTVSEEYTYQKGRVVTFTFEDSLGKPTTNLEGVVTGRFELDPQGDVVKTEFFGTDDKPLLTKKGYFRSVSKFDAWGNEIDDSYYDLGGQPTLTDGFSRVVYQVDSRGLETEESYMGIDGQPCLRQGCARLTIAYDAQGYQSDYRYYGVDGKPLFNAYGAAHVHWKYDSRGNIIETRYFDTDDHPTSCKLGYATFRSQFDSHGNLARQDYLDTEEKPILVDGAASVLCTYDDRNNQCSISFLDQAGAPSLRNGYCRSVNTYDERDNIVQVDYFGPNGKPILGKDGYARMSQKYDDAGHVIEQSYFGVSGERISCGGAWRLERKYDDRGNEIDTRYYDIDDSLRKRDGSAEVKRTFDATGHELTELYFDRSGDPAVTPAGIAGMAWSYDARGNTTEELSLGPDRHLLKTPNRVARRTWLFDALGNPTRICCFNGDNQPVLSDDGYAILTTDYNIRGQQIRADYFGTDGKPILCKKGFATALWQYDARGNMVQIDFLGIHEEAVLDQDGEARIVGTYDAQGRQIESQLFGVDGKPVVSKLNGARKTWRYDARGNCAELDFYGTDGLPMEVTNHAAKIIFKYNALDQVVEMDLFDRTGKLVQHQTAAH